MKALISRAQNGPISAPHERLHERPGGCEKYLLLKDNGFLDEIFGIEWEIVR